MTPPTLFPDAHPPHLPAPPDQLLYHVPQHSRREKLRFAAEDAAASSQAAYYTVDGSYSAPFPAQHAASGFSLSLSSPAPAAKRTLVGPFGPFTGYAAVLGRSRFLGPAEKLLEEICDRVGDDGAIRAGGDEGSVSDEVEMEVDVDDAGDDDVGPELQWRKTRLLSLMEEVCKRYKQYYHQAQAVISSFETVAGLSAAAPYASTALKSMAKQFKSLKLAITAQLRATGKPEAWWDATVGSNADAAPPFPTLAGGDPAPFHRAVTFPPPAFGQPQNVWRPQRGLPERAVAVLRAWLFEHFLHPYPSDGDKQMLAKQTGLTRNQVSNWFINARVRLWKPMVEEIHNLEIRQTQEQPPPAGKKHPGIAPQAQQSSDSSAALSDCHPGEAPCIDLSSGVLPGHGHPSTGLGVFGMSGGSGSVSLTLGLQNNRSCLIDAPLAADPVPANLVRRFGLDDIGDTYMMSSLISGGQLLRDYAG